MKKDCPKFKKWFENISNLSSFVCYESNMVNDNINTWWTDPGSTIHICILLAVYAKPKEASEK